MCKVGVPLQLMLQYLFFISYEEVHAIPLA